MMGRDMKTIREGRVDKMLLRLLQKGTAFIGIIISNGETKARVEGEIADEVWRRLHEEAAKANPKYVGFAGARARFLGFFPNGFHSAGFAKEERDYKIAAKVKLDATVPVEAAATGSGYGEA